MNAKLLCALTLCGWSSTAFGQLKQDSVNLNEKKEQLLSEVIVTAQKRIETLVSVNTSISYLSDKKIQDTRTWGLADLTAIIPNYQYGDMGATYQQIISLRGISVFSGNPSIATYIDGVNALDITANGLQLVDIERIEVLRGPQGTLYGRNAMGGVLNIITKKPTNATTGFAEVSLGNNGLQRYGAGIKVPLVKNKLQIGWSGQYQRTYGYYRNDLSNTSLQGSAVDGVRINDETSYYGNLFLRYTPVTQLELTYNVKVQLDQSPYASGYYLTAPDPETAINKPYSFSVNRLGSSSRKVMNQSLSFNYVLPGITISGISAWQYVGVAYDNIDFIDQSPRDVGYSASFHKRPGDIIPQYVFSQELRVSSARSASRLNWSLGSYVFLQEYPQRSASIYERDAASLFGIPDSSAQLFFPRTAVAQTDLSNRGLAFFGQADYLIGNRFKITAGVRYDNEWRQATIASYTIEKTQERTYSQADTTKRKRFTAWSPKLVVTYKFSEHQHMYLSYSRGFRAGGINMYSRMPGADAYAPEYSDNYELGYKHFSTNRKWSFSGTLFLMSWRDLQLYYSPDGVSSIISNLGRVRSCGAEMEVTALPLSRLQLDMSIGTNNAKYRDIILDGKSISGNRTIMAPTITSYLGLQYTLPVSGKIKAVIRGEWRHFGEQYFDVANTIRQAPYSLFSGRAGVSAEKVSIHFWIQNLADQHYIAYASPFTSFSRSTLLGRPRAFGVTLSARI